MKGLYIPLRLCYNTPDATGKQVEFLYEPVAVKRLPSQEGTRSGLTPAARGTGSLEPQDSEKADLTAPSRNTRASRGQRPAKHHRKRRECRQVGKHHKNKGENKHERT